MAHKSILFLVLFLFSFLANGFQTELSKNDSLEIERADSYSKRANVTGNDKNYDSCFYYVAESKIIFKKHNLWDEYIYMLTQQKPTFLMHLHLAL